MKRPELGGLSLTRDLGTALGVRDNGSHVGSDEMWIQGIKHKYGQVAPNTETQTQRAALSCEATKIYLPDGNFMELNVGNAMRATTEQLFNSRREGSMSMQEVASICIHKADVDIRGDLLRSVIVHGGTSHIPGLIERLKNELKAILPPTANLNVIKSDHNAVWTGGSILAALSTFDQMWISKAEYSDTGPSIVHRKCF